MRVDCTPYWWQSAPRPERGADPLPEGVDVLVVGAGYTGASAALTLARAGRSVLICERARAGEGASSRNAGMMSGSLKASFGKLVRVLGLARAREVYRESAEARHFLHALIERERIECGRMRSGRLTPAVTPRHYEGLAREAELLRRELGTETYAVPRREQGSEIGSDLYHGGVINEEVASFHPGEYHLGLLSCATRRGATVASRTEVTGLGVGPRGFDVRTSAGPVAARNVIIATNGYTTPGLGWWHRRVVPVSSQMVATVPIGTNLMTSLLPRGRVVVESSHLFHYFRPSPDGTRLLAGGRYGGGDAGLGPGLQAIRSRLRQVFDQLDDVEIAHTWSGYTAFTRDFFPHLGVAGGVHYAMGFCGSGTVWGTWLGHKLALMILGDPEGRSVFERPLPSIPLYRGKPWFLPPAMGWFALRDRLGL